MIESEWLSSADPVAILDYLDPRGMPKLSDRKLRLFVAGCFRERWDYNRLHGDVPDAKSIRAIEDIEGFSDGGDELKMLNSWKATKVFVQPGIAFGTRAGTRIFAHSLCERENPDRRNARAALLREIFGNPWRRIGYWDDGQLWIEVSQRGTGKREWSVAKWLKPAIVSVAQRIYDERAFGDLPVLADMLEEASCDQEELLQHLRGFPLRMSCKRCKGTGIYQVRSGGDPVRNKGSARSFSGRRTVTHRKMETTVTENLCEVCDASGSIAAKNGPHVRGCWALDLILGNK